MRAGTPVRGQQCPVCGPGSLLVTAEEASQLRGETVRAICRWAENGEVHSLDAPDGRLLVCLASLTLRVTRASAESFSAAPGTVQKAKSAKRGGS